MIALAVNESEPRGHHDTEYNEAECDAQGNLEAVATCVVPVFWGITVSGIAIVITAHIHVLMRSPMRILRALQSGS